jgi:hypothetical protein
MDNVQDRIAKRAFDLFVARGGEHGYHIADWLQAEKEILAEKVKTVPGKTKKAKTKTPVASKKSPVVTPKKKVAPRKK